MARKERNNIDYFPHPVIHGRKMWVLRSKYKNDGYAIWFMLLEELGKADYHYLDLSDKVQLMYLSAQFMVSEEVLSNIIVDLVEMEVFDEELWKKHKILFNEKFCDNISDAYKRRNNECITKEGLVLHLQRKCKQKRNKCKQKQHKCNPTDSKNTQTKLYYTKLNKTKDNSPEVNGGLMFDFDEYLDTLVRSGNRVRHIVGLYWKVKGYRHTTELAAEAAMKRDYRAAKNLKGYDDAHIIGLMKWFAKPGNVDYEWKLDTVFKKIDDYIVETNK